MAAIVETPSEERRWTALEKFQRLRAKARVEVRLINGAWVGARIDHTNRGGAYCKTDKGLETFFVWNMVRPPPDSFDPAKPIAKLGDIAKQTTLRAVPPFLDTTPTPQPPPRPIQTTIAPASAGRTALLISREDLGMPKPNQKRLPEKRKTELPRTSPIGNLLRGKRLERQISQLDMAKKLTKLTKGGGAIYNSRVSQIELGKTLPTDEELIAYAEVFDLDLDDLLAARKHGRHAARAPEATPPPAPDVEGLNGPASAVAATPSQQTLVRVVPAAAAASPPPAPSSLTDFAAFTDTLCAVSPLPLDRDARREWFQLAIKLFETGEQVTEAELNGSPKLTVMGSDSPEYQRAHALAEAMVGLIANEPHPVRSIALALIVETFVAREMLKGAPCGVAVGMVIATSFAQAPMADLVAGFDFALAARKQYSPEETG